MDHPPPPQQGKAVVACKVLPSNRLRNCRVVSETPMHANVGSFALQLVRNFHVEPGDPRVKDGRITIRLQFKMPEPGEKS
ncbi:MAG: hypothetical protein CFE28_06955 [Alphaproteobacteria bacterium PA2]|jgi:TonB family protein|nr:MAG: hypothetical protein CFE28_06955 [Alphaproteobacteria bacterium PA2]